MIIIYIPGGFEEVKVRILSQRGGRTEEFYHSLNNRNTTIAYI
jgi:hypothetical protein